MTLPMPTKFSSGVNGFLQSVCAAGLMTISQSLVNNNNKTFRALWTISVAGRCDVEGLRWTFKTLENLPTTWRTQIANYSKQRKGVEVRSVCVCLGMILQIRDVDNSITGIWRERVFC